MIFMSSPRCHGVGLEMSIYVKPGFHMIVSDVRIVSVAECFITRSGRKDRTWFCRNDQIVSDVRIVYNNRKSVSI